MRRNAQQNKRFLLRPAALTEYFSSAQSNQCFLSASYFDLCQRFLMANCENQQAKSEKTKKNTTELWPWRNAAYPDAVADPQHDVALWGVPFVQDAAGDEDHCGWIRG